MSNWETNAKYAEEFKKKTTLTPRLPRKIYDLRWALALGKITFKEYEEKIKRIKNDN